MLKNFFLAIIFAAFLSLNTCYASETLASTTPDSEGWILAIEKDDDGDYLFVAYNDNTQQGGLVAYDKKFYNFYLNESPIIFIMGVAKSPRDVDVNFGEWSNDGEAHVFPVYALFEYNNGRVTLDSYLSSGEGLHPSHYQGRIQSPYHIKLAEVFLMKMPELHKVVESKGVNLP